MSGRDFSMSGEIPVPERRIDNDAPVPMRTELLDSVFALADDAGAGPSARTLYIAVTGALGEIAAVNPYGGLCRRASEVLARANWSRVFDIILRLVPEFTRAGRLAEYRQAVNTILAAHGVIWDLDENGRFVRVLPDPAGYQVRSAIQELANPEFQAARELFGAGQDAFNSIPRRDRDACVNAFNAMESVGRTRFGGATLGDVLDRLQGNGAVDQFIVRTVRGLEVVRHNHLGHGAQQPFNLSAAEVDFVYLGCVAGLLLLVRL